MPTIDSSFLPERPKDILERGDFDPALEVIIGANTGDGILYMMDPTLYQDMRENFDTVAPSKLFFLGQSDITDKDISNAKK